MSVRVEVSMGLFDEVRAATDAAGGDRARLGQQLGVVLESELFGADRDAIRADVESWFDLDQLSQPGGGEGDLRIAEHLMGGATGAGAELGPFLPAAARRDDMRLTVHPVPGFRRCYGSSPGTQIFGIRAGADPREALLFLVHVCYHEIAEHFYTEASRRAAAERDGPDALRHWILLLVQNEGLANYAVLEPLLELRDELTTARYFTYMDAIGDADATARALTVLQRALAAIDEDNWRELEPRLVAFLKDPRLPVINLAGIHIACSVAAAHGADALIASIREPQELFALYTETEDPLREHLFGARGEAASAFGLIAEPELRP
jgi:hypothetical protein